MANLIRSQVGVHNEEKDNASLQIWNGNQHNFECYTQRGFSFCVQDSTLHFVTQLSRPIYVIFFQPSGPQSIEM
jgi:hypothetical protein